MAQECGFFNAELEGGEYDRVYNAEQFAAYFASFIGNGIFADSMSELVVVENETPNMSVNVSSGQGWINGWWYRNTEDYNLAVDVADGVLSRIDIVVLRWGNVERDMWLHVIKGTPSAEPSAPSITRDADYYDLKLCEISIPAGAANIRQAQITDTRAIADVCGFVTGIIDQIDATDLFLQFQAQFGDFMDVNYEYFNTWFQHMKDQLSTDAAGHLQAEVDDLSGSIAPLYNQNQTYSVGNVVMYNNVRYRCIQAITLPEPWTQEHWIKQDVQEVLDNTSVDLSSVSDEYDPEEGTYAVGAYCIYNNTLYKCDTAVAIPEIFDPTKWHATSIAEEIMFDIDGTKIPEGTTVGEFCALLANRFYPNALWMYKDGAVENIDWSGSGFSDIGSQLQISGRTGICYSATTIDLTNYTTIHFRGDYGVQGLNTYGTWVYGVAKNQGGSYAASRSIATQNYGYGNLAFDIDVSDLTGLYYVQFAQTDSREGYGNRTRVSRIWLD